ncbi:hypothetical protein ERO13_D10G120500v2 [Gossypium hirsutum]|nr:LEAF RUST 10 DISEASE-RESISTANCE LOCUS RECEPTOR-LIKE PROTEIN KINASE-like 2.1 isoform X2 [Gossypium hirsutum]KAG4125799.1 hypothetical protein ERO13_D10G120500v2 [Gossypium hirsutum]
MEEARCGYPGFNISCKNNINPIIRLPDDGDYVIHNIFYQDQSFHISRADPFDADDVCSNSIRNISIPQDPFFLPPKQVNMSLFFDCVSVSELPKSLGFFKVVCDAKYGTNVTLSLLSNYNEYSELSYASRYCNKTVVLPAPVDLPGNETAVQGILNRGFISEWKSSKCSDCEASGGKCGFDDNANNFKCFCQDRPRPSSCAPGKNSHAHIKVAVGYSIAGTVVLIILLACFIRTFSFNDRRFIWQMKVEGDKKIEAFLNRHEFLTPKRYRYSDVKNMTNSFRDKLGKGGYGNVYKGKLLDGQLVAVKILNKSKSNGEDFMHEVSSISRTSHVNIVTLLSFCFEGRRRALIYEFVPNGSLEKFIFQKNGDRQLTWEMLYKIAVGIARGLEYLHRGCKTRILHFDIKPHNILLDDDFCPKISDFGLAKLCPGKESVISMTGCRGTIGYIAPEVYSRNFGRVSHKSDVYSYGMMVLEMVGGKILNDEDYQTSEIYFPHWIYSRIELDEELRLQGIVDDDVDQERVRKMILVSLWCIQTDPANRPPMSRVLEMMEGNIDSLTIPPKPFL